MHFKTHINLCLNNKKSKITEMFDGFCKRFPFLVISDKSFVFGSTIIMVFNWNHFKVNALVLRFKSLTRRWHPIRSRRPIARLKHSLRWSLNALLINSYLYIGRNHNTWRHRYQWQSVVSMRRHETQECLTESSSTGSSGSTGPIGSDVGSGHTRGRWWRWELWLAPTSSTIG